MHRKRLECRVKGPSSRGFCNKISGWYACLRKALWTDIRTDFLGHSTIHTFKYPCMCVWQGKDTLRQLFPRRRYFLLILFSEMTSFFFHETTNFFPETTNSFPRDDKFFSRDDKIFPLGDKIFPQDDKIFSLRWQNYFPETTIFFPETKFFLYRR